MAKKEQNEKLTEEYKYEGEGELLSDISSSEPLKKINRRVKNNKVKKLEENVEIEERAEEVKNVNENTIQQKLPSFKEIYTSMLNENKPFVLKMNGTVIFDSEKDDIMLLCFEENYFRVGVEIHTYEGLNFKFKK